MARVVIVGSGHAGVEAASSLRSNGFGGAITVVGDDPFVPYHRPPLSKGYLAGESEIDAHVLRSESYFEKRRLDLRRGVRADAIDRSRNSVFLNSGDELSYDYLILATGARARTLAVPGAGLDGVFVLRSLVDAQRLRKRLPSAREVVVVGAGFIGLECAAVANRLGARTTVVEQGNRAMARVVTERCASFVVDQHRSRGNTVMFGREIVAFHGGEGSIVCVELDDGQRLPADVVIVGIGVTPNTEIAEHAGLPVDNGIVVDELLHTDDGHIWAIGDCANHPNKYASGRVRLESVQNAVDQARCVAATIGGAPMSYAAVPWFWTHQFSTKLQIAGLVNGTEVTVLRPSEDPMAFSVFCFDSDRLTAVESVNQPREHMIARRLLGSGGCLTPEQAADRNFDLKTAEFGRLSD